ncbi:hypothetical protein K488DRAFT_39117, partial [Vararia minispora EC-137]
YAMGCGFLPFTLNSVRLVALVDCGVELNLVPDHVVEACGLVLSHEGATWSLKGVLGHSSRLAGSLRDVAIDVGGHPFAHHFLVTRG